MLIGIPTVAAEPERHICDCVRLAPISTEIRRETPFVFSGTVIEIMERHEHTMVTRGDGATSTARPLERRVVFRVSSGWRGVARERFEVQAEISDCMFPFEIGDDYVVFARQDARGRAHTDICTRTTALKAASGILGVLGPPVYRSRDDVIRR